MNERYQAIRKALDNGQLTERITDKVTGDECITADGIRISGEAVSEGIREHLTLSPVLLLFGAGHVGKALYDLAILQGMRTVVLDDRKEELTEKRFPLAERHVGTFSSLLSCDYGIPHPYAVIFTHGHSYDLDALRYMLSRPFSYLGMIGSKAKAAAQVAAVRAEGFPEDRIECICSPVGLGINAVTPEEIAVSIMAEIISVFRSDRSATVIDRSFLDILEREEGIIARITDKEGSAPRSTGSAMLVTREGTFSTIGGGSIESIAINEARKMMRNNEERKILHLDLSKGGNAGMICGGSVTILLTANR